MAELEVDPASVPEAVSWCVAHGAVYALPKPDMAKLGAEYDAGLAFSHAPFALAPFPWPRAEYERVRRLQPTLSRVIDRASRDEAWLLDALKETVQSDAFTAAVARVYRECPNPQSLRLGLLRSDYMLDEKGSGDKRKGTAPPPARSLQVEINTIASSFACLSQTVSELHAFLGAKKRRALSTTLKNEAGRGMAAGLAAAHGAYCAQRGIANDAAAVAMVVQPEERNQMDQRKLEHWLWDDHGIAMRRVTLAAVADETAGATPATPLVLGGAEISVVYYRAGYAPEDYPTEAEWAARKVIEASVAVKCPSAAYQLVGTKKVQQALAAPGALERFVRDGDVSADEVRTVFAGLYDLDEAAPGVGEAVDAALAAPEAYVLKPQREGGGNNLYGADVADALRKFSPAERAAYILMERIVSKPKPGVLVRNAHRIAGDCVAELGIYGAYLADGDGAELHNEVCGHLLRQKLLGVDEGGVAAGFAVLSSPDLV